MAELFATGPMLDCGAIISECQRYRYRLWRLWDGVLPECCFVMLNPSTADAREDDPTIRRCLHFARREGCGRLEVVNLFAFRATDPAELRRLGRIEAIGEENNDHVADATRWAKIIVAAWGTKGGRQGEDMQRRLHDFRKDRLYCLGKTRAGLPKHPLYLPNDAALEPF